MKELVLQHAFWIIVPLAAGILFFGIATMFWFVRFNRGLKARLGDRYFIVIASKDGRAEMKRIVDESPDLLRAKKALIRMWALSLLYILLVFSPVFFFIFYAVYEQQT